MGSPGRSAEIVESGPQDVDVRVEEAWDERQVTEVADVLSRLGQAVESVGIRSRGHHAPVPEGQRPQRSTVRITEIIDPARLEDDAGGLGEAARVGNSDHSNAARSRPARWPGAMAQPVDAEWRFTRCPR